MRMPCVLVYKLGKTCDDPDFFPGRGAKRTVFGPRKTGHDILSSSSSSAAIGELAVYRTSWCVSSDDLGIQSEKSS